MIHNPSKQLRKIVDIDKIELKVGMRIGKLVVVSTDASDTTCVCDCDEVVTYKTQRLHHTNRPNQCFLCVKKGMQNFNLGKAFNIKKDKARYPVLAEEVSRAMIDNFIGGQR